MRRFVVVSIIAAIALGCAQTLAQQVQSGAGVASFNGRRGKVALQLSDLPASIPETVTPSVGDGTTTVFTIAPTVANPSLLNVSVGGVLQTGYVATSTTVAFVQAPPPDAAIVVLYGALPSAPGGTLSVLAPVPETITPSVGDGTTATFTISPPVQDATRLFINAGGFDQTGRFSLTSPTTITFNAPPPLNALLRGSFGGAVGGVGTLGPLAYAAPDGTTLTISNGQLSVATLLSGGVRNTTDTSGTPGSLSGGTR